jgi:hypothetical protein
MLWLKLHKQISPSITMFPRGLFTSTNITTQLFRTFFFCFIRFFVIPPSRMFVECLHPFLCDTIYLKQWKIIHFSIIFRENCVDYIRYSNILIEEYGTYTIYLSYLLEQFPLEYIHFIKTERIPNDRDSRHYIKTFK